MRHNRSIGEGNCRAEFSPKKIPQLEQQIKILNTDLAFEYSTVDIESTTKIDSVKNPLGGTIRAPAIGETILEEARVDVSRTTFITGMTQ